jgi:hypothetical protein
MITIALALFVGLGIFGLIWHYVKAKAIEDFKGAPLTFTPLEYKPAQQPDGSLQWDANGYLVSVPTGSYVPFEPRHERYMKIAEVMTALGSASLVFVPNSRLSVYPHSCAFALVLLGFSVLYSVLFMAALTYFYEGFLYNNDTYLAWKYGLVHALGFGGLVCFVLSYFVLAVRVGWALIYAQVVGSSKLFSLSSSAFFAFFAAKTPRSRSAQAMRLIKGECSAYFWRSLGPRIRLRRRRGQ